jgi:xanthine dehydrogenase accessory factor
MMKQLYHEMADLAVRGESFVLANVIGCNGSVPRSLGAKMIVRQDGTTLGTIGGGALEAQVEQLAGVVQKNHRAMVRDFEFNGKNATTNEAICGGQVEILVEWLDVSDPTLAKLLMNLSAAAAENRKIWWVTSLPTDGFISTHVLVRKDGTLMGLLPPGLSPENVIATHQPVRVLFEEKPYFVDPLDNTGTVYIFGAGLVSQSVAAFNKAAGFWTVVLDDRVDIVSSQRFPTADQLIVLDTFSDAFSRIEVDLDSFLVLVTRGHLLDRNVLAQALRTSAGYIGMMGSHRKCELIFDELRKQGFSDGDIQRVHAPIGIDIDAETPEEIGISIAAEMIQVRAKMR